MFLIKLIIKTNALPSHLLPPIPIFQQPQPQTTNTQPQTTNTQHPPPNTPHVHPIPYFYYTFVM